MKFCSACGARVTLTLPPGDDRERYVCDRCATVHYQNPRVVTGCIPEWEDRILLCRRAIEPRRGLWTLPAGFMENAETTAEGAARETLEEANARVEMGSLFALIDIPYINQIYMLFRARLIGPDVSPGRESLEVRLLGESEIPWEEIAFPAIEKTLRWYLADRGKGKFALHVGDIRECPGREAHAVGNG